MSTSWRNALEPMIEAVDWTKLHSAGRSSAVGASVNLRVLFSGSEHQALENAYQELTQNDLSVQGMFFDSALAAVPILWVALLSDLEPIAKTYCIQIIGEFTEVDGEEIERTGLTLLPRMRTALDSGQWLLASFLSDPDQGVRSAAAFALEGFPDYQLVTRVAVEAHPDEQFRDFLRSRSEVVRSWLGADLSPK